MNQERILMRSPSVLLERQREDYQNQKSKLLLREQTANLADARKKCFKCDQEKPLNEFYRHPQMADGRLGKCKECTKLDIANQRRDPVGREAVRRNDKERFQFPSRKRKVLEYNRKSRAENPEKYKARMAVGNSIRAGKLTRLPCEVCGDPKSEAHHHDYSKPLDVRWLCFKHHRADEHGHIVGSITDMKTKPISNL